MPPLEPDKLARVLQRAANLRIDVKRASFKIAEDNPGLLLIDVDYTSAPGHRKRGEFNLGRLLESGKTIGAVLDGLLGEQPPDPCEHQRAAALLKERRRLWDCPIGQIPEPIQAASSPTSKLHWPDQTQRPETPEGSNPIQVPATPVQAGQNDDARFYTEGGERKPKLTHQQMVDYGFTTTQRHEQYRRQKGRHPSDEQVKPK